MSIFVNNLRSRFEVSLSHSIARHRPDWLGNSVFRLDDLLRKLQHVYEYSDDPACLFRIQRARAAAEVKLADGVRVRKGDPILNLHLWNEHMPRLDSDGMDFKWARRIGREIGASLERLALHMAEDLSYDDIVALRAEMRFGTAEQNVRIVRLSARYGFERVRMSDSERYGAVRELGENALVLMLVLAANPGAARFCGLRHDCALIYMSRANLDRHYLPGAMADDASRSQRNQ
jgi:hypothetical protein